MRSFAFICLSLASHCLLASTQINQGLVGYWPLNEDALDYSGNGYHGTLLEGAHFVDNPNGEGRVLQNVRGEKNYGHVLVDLPASVHTSQSFEIGFKTSGAFWVQFDDRLPLTDAAGWQGIISKPPGMLYISRNLGANRINPMVKSQEQGHHSTINYWPKTPNNSLNQEGVWYHIAWTFHSHHAGDPDGHFRWYINGEKVLDDNGGVQTLLASSSVDFRIGANWSKTANNTKISQMRLYNRILSADEVKLLADTPAGQNISSAELRVEGGMAIEENLSVAGSIHLGDYKTTVNSLFISEPGQLRYKDGDFEGYDGNEWKSLTGINDNQLTTEGIIESTSGGFKLPDGTVIDSADDLGNASNLQDGSGNAVVQVTNDGNLELSTPLNHDDSLTTSHNLVLNNHALIASHAGNPAAGNVDYMYHFDTNDGNQKGVWKFFSDSTLTATQPNSLIEAGAIKLNGIQDSIALNVNGDAKIEGTMSLKNTTLEPIYVKAGEFQVGYRKIIYRGQSITFQTKVGQSIFRGLGVVIIDRISGEIDSAYNYDVYGGGSEVQNALANDLSLLDSSKIVIVASNSTWRYNDAIKAQLHRIGASNIFEKFGPSPYRRSYALIGIPGLGLAGGLEAFSETSQSLPMAELATVLMKFNNQEISIGGLNQQSQFMLDQLTTEGVIESTSGGFKLPDGTVINSADDLDRHNFLSDGNLVFNGYAHYKSNQNFSSASFIGLDFVDGYGSFDAPIGYRRQFYTDQLIPISKGTAYEFSYQVRSPIYNDGNKVYGVIRCYDIDKKLINAQEITHFGNTLTSLSKDLNDGDMLIHLNDLSTWSHHSAHYRRKIMIWNYTNSLGYTYPVGTYTRNWKQDLWDNASQLDYTNNLIHLSEPWNKGFHATGTPVSQGNSGGTYMYPMSSFDVEEDWIGKKAIINNFRPGTAFIDIGWLTDWTSKGSTTRVADVYFGAASNRAFEHNTNTTTIQNQLTTEGIIESTSGGFKLPDGTVIDSADDLGNASALLDSSGTPVIQVAENGTVNLTQSLQLSDGTVLSSAADLGNASNLQDAAGNAVVQVAENGTVGIGTNSPQADLHVAGNLQVDGQVKLTAPANGIPHIGDVPDYIQNPEPGPISHDAVNGALSFTTNGAERMRIDGDGNLGIGTTSPNAKFELNNSSDISMFKIKSGNGNDDVGKDFVIEAYQPSISFIDRSTGGNSSAISYNQNSIHFSDLNSIGDIGQKMTINTETGKVGIGTTNPQAKLEINDNSASSKLVIRNYAHYFGYGIDFYGKAGHTGFTPLNFRNSNGTIVGQVNHNNSSTSYNTSSDYRLKEDISEITDSVARLQALKPCNFRWKADGTRVDGFIAHEAQAVVPAAVSGTKDAVDAEGNPEYQGIDHGKLVPLLTKALQEALTRIETLEAEVAQLKQP